MISSTAFESKFTKVAAPDEDGENPFRTRFILSACGASITKHARVLLGLDLRDRGLGTARNLEIHPDIYLTKPDRHEGVDRDDVSRFYNMQNNMSIFDTNQYGNSTIGWYGGKRCAIATQQKREASQLG